MRGYPLAFLAAASLALVLTAAPARAADDAPPGVKGLYLLTDYPSISVRPGATSTVSLRLQNYALPPERLALSVSGVPQGWTVTLIGGGQPIAAAMPATNSSVALQLRLEIPADAALGTQTLTVTAAGQGTSVALPVAVTLAKDLPAKLTVEPQLPELRGTAKSAFDFQLNIKNDSGRNLVVRFAAQAPANFETKFTEQYGSQEISSIPIDAGQSKGIKLGVRPPSTIGAGRYPVTVRVSAEDANAEARIALEITGSPRLVLAGRGGILSASAESGKETSVPVVVTNTGSAPAEDIELSGSGPTGWKIAFEPKAVDKIAPNENKEVQALITPPARAIAGDYSANLRASSRSESATADFRVTLGTSTIWGVVALGIVGIALLILVGAVWRFGRR